MALSFDAQVATDDPLLACCHFPAFVQQTVLPVPVKQEHADFELGDDGRWCRFAFGWWIWIEDRLASFAAGRGRGEVEEQRPSGFGGHRLG